MILALLAGFLAVTVGQSISVELNRQSFSQGETVRIEVTSASDSCVLLFDGDEHPLYPVDAAMVGLIGLSADFPIGIHRFELVSGSSRCTVHLDVRPTEYTREKITFPQEKRDLLNVDITEERRTIRDVLGREGGERHWRSCFRIPVTGRITSPYGIRRNGGYHRGVDISAASGAIIQAPAGAVVALTGDFPIHGRTLILAHGEGVSTIYCHLDTVLVNEGDLVEAGSTLARVGNTGLGTAPHLHWGLYVHGVSVNPMEWLAEEY